MYPELELAEFIALSEDLVEPDAMPNVNLVG